jgi:hypothetical protein
MIAKPFSLNDICQPNLLRMTEEFGAEIRQVTGAFI